ncbi:protein germ cell-less-like [Pollicipes pollicipes]|uniref:protein germ cell-less-like n=1 Tax=Pollicipes pollicipes TaxID=41117 RepID=UPI0018853156|nr:protein germ cell-less-like [Pollicipes pollicipes]
MAHLVLHPLDFEVLHADNIIRPGWLAGLYRHQWLTLLRLDQGLVEPGWSRDVTEAQFDACALRCGRTLKDRQKVTWRWTGFNFGVDLVMVHSRRQISLRRNVRQELPLLISQANSRDVIYRSSSGLTAVQLARGQEVRVLTLDEAATYPLLLAKLSSNSKHAPRIV